MEREMVEVRKKACGGNESYSRAMSRARIQNLDAVHNNVICACFVHVWEELWDRWRLS